MTTITRNAFALRDLATPYTTVDTARAGRDLLGAVACLFGVWAQRLTTRAHLRRLDVHLLDDIGLSVADAEREAGKPFWRA